MKENFLNLAKKINFQEVQEVHRVPKKLGQMKHTPRHIIITLSKIKDKERILKAAREKDTITYKGVPISLKKCERLRWPVTSAHFFTSLVLMSL